MAVSKGRNRASEFEELVDAAPKGMLPWYLENSHARMLTIPADFDPEADIPESDSDASGDDDQEDKDAGARDHYAPVGKSKLRKPKEIALGPQYSGSRVARDAIEGDDDDDDPFARGFDDEDSEEEQDDGSEEDDEELEDGTDATGMSDEEDEDDELAVGRALDLKIAEKRVGAEEVEGLVDDVGLRWIGHCKVC